MAFGVFIHRRDSIYDDIPWKQYQFPKQYLSRAKQCVGDWIVYYEPSKVPETKGYYATARVQEIISDPRASDMYLALIEPNSYLEFGALVSFRKDGEVIEQGLLNDDGQISGRAQAGIRPLSPEDFSRIVEYGLSTDEELLPRSDNTAQSNEFAEFARYNHDDPRARAKQIVNRPIRDRNFRATILRAYQKRCAVTGLKLINGGGRAEVEAAHIKPVSKNGPDTVGNGIALSGTVHWMFDRGLISLAPDFEIIISRQTNNPDTVRSLINESGKLLLPEKALDHPKAEFVKWHRNECFKN